MKVDILGRGIIPGLGVLAPMFDKDLTETELDKILKQSALKIYISGSKVPVIRRNLHQLIMMGDGKSNVDIPAVKPVKPEEKVTPIAEPVKEEPAAVEPVVEEAPAVEETVEAEAVAEEVTEAEEAVTTEQPVSSKKKKNRK